MFGQRLLRYWILALMSALVVGTGLLSAPGAVLAQEPVPVSITLSGWGWCIAYREIGGVVADLTGYRIPRDNATDVEDVYLEGTLSFNIADRSDSFELELRGTKVRSLFFLKQVSVGADNMTADMMAEFEGTWLGETDYVACEGRITLSAPNHVGKPYFFLLRTAGTAIPARERGGWVGNMEFVIQKLTGAFDEVADRLSVGGTAIKEELGDFLMQVAVIGRDLRNLGVPYFT